MFTALDGYKTYIVVAALVLVALAEGVLHWDIPGVDLTGNWVEALLAALGLGALRNGVAKV